MFKQFGQGYASKPKGTAECPRCHKRGLWKGLEDDGAYTFRCHLCGYESKMFK